MVKDFISGVNQIIDDPKTRSLVQDFMDSVDVSDYQSVKKFIFPMAIRAEGNKDMLENRPHIESLDFAVVFDILITRGGEDAVTMPVINSLAEKWNVLPPVIYEDAMRNNMKNFPAVVTPIEDVLGLASKKDGPNNTIFVLTNSARYYGATTMFYEGELERFYKFIGMPFSIIPSSVHEVLLIPGSLKISNEELKGMLIDVNETIVADKDILGDHIYRFDPDNGLRIAE